MLLRNGVGEQGLVVLDAAPLRVVDDLGAIEAAVDVGGDVAGEPVDDRDGGVGQQVYERRLPFRFDGEHVHEGDEVLVGCDRCYRLPPLRRRDISMLILLSAC